MSEITKLMENAEIEKQTFCSKTDTCYDGRLSECEGCNAYHYPPFTEKKQLELIKWCLLKYENVDICYMSGIYYIEGRGRISDDCDTLEEAIASFINSYWYAFTTKEKAEIKEILND